MKYKHVSITGVISFYDTWEEAERRYKLEFLIVGVGYTAVGVLGIVLFLRQLLG